MNQQILINIDPLLKATNNGKLDWQLIENTSCLTTNFNRNKFIICRYTFEDSLTTVIAFNYLSDSDSDEEFNQWDQADPVFAKLNDLYDAAQSHSTALVTA